MRKTKKVIFWILSAIIWGYAIYVILIDPLMMFYKYDGWFGVLKWIGMLSAFFIGLRLFVRLMVWLNDEE